MKRLLLFLLSVCAWAQTGPMLPDGIPFASSGGSTNTFTLVNQTNQFPTSCTPTCNLTVTSTGSGHLLVIQATNQNGGARYLSSVTGGGTWVVPAGCEGVNASAGAVSCAYVLSSSPGTTTFAVTTTTNDGYEFVTYEVSYTPGPISFDTSNATAQSASTNPPGQALTLAGTSELIFQTIALPANGPSGISAPYTNYLNWFNGGFATSFNTSSGTAPTWTWGTSNPNEINAFAFK